MITNIKLKKHKGISELSINNLSRVNVICGKNNSGKTSILEAIVKPECFVPGIRCTKEIKEAIIVLLQEHLVIPKLPPEIRRPHNVAVDEFTNGEQEILYLDCCPIWDVYCEVVTKYKDGQFNGVYSSVLNKLKTYVKDVVSPPKTVLLPSQRAISITESGFSYTTGLVGSGSNLLQCIHSLQNSIPYSSADKLFMRLRDAFLQVSGGYHLKTIHQESSIELFFSQNEYDWYSNRDLGRGLSDLAIILYHSIVSEFPLVLVDEIENHMHPEMQRKLAEYILNKTTKQFIFTTHSSVYLSPYSCDKSFCCQYSEGSICIDDVSSRMTALTDLGYSPTDNLLADLIVLIEGPTDKPFYEILFRKWGIIPEYNVKFWPLGGDTMYHIDLDLFEGMENVIAVVDNDPGSAKVRNRFIQTCNDLGITVIKLKRYSIENYPSINAYREVFGSQVSTSITTLKHDEKVEDQLGFNPKKSLGKLASSSEVDDLNTTDLQTVQEASLRILKTDQ